MRKPTSILRELLLNDSEVVSFFGQRIYPVNSPKQDLPQIIIYTRNVSTNDKSQITYNEFDAHVLALFPKDRYDLAEEWFFKIQNLLHGKQTFSDNKRESDIRFDASDEGFSMIYNAQYQELIFKVKVN